MRLRLLVAGILVVACTAPLVSAAERTKPNVVIFYADDLGWGECGCYGCKDIPTPHIDAIAKNGVRFTQGYVAATYCSPSRAGLMTGRYPTRFGHEFNSVAKVGLDPKETTLASRLKELGYATACIGKWHLGGSPACRPTARGFDEFFGTLANTPYFHPKNFVDSRISQDVRPINDDSFYTTDEYAKRSVEWIGEHRGKPFFLYLPFNAQHAPLQAPDAYLDRFPDIREKRRRHFAAMMSAMDDAVGRVMATVRQLALEEKTLYFFIGDNGGPTNSTTSSNGALRGFKATTFEGGPRVPFIAQWKGTLPAATSYENPVLNLDVLPTVLAAAGGTIEPAWKLDGVDLMPYLTGANTARPHETIYWRFGMQWAVRRHDLKLVVSKGGSGKPELYDLATDLSESNDLAAQRPETVKELQTLWDTWSAEQAEPRLPAEKGKAKRKKKLRQAASAAAQL